MAAAGHTKATLLTVKSIGTDARDYSTIAAWEAACPASLQATDEIYWGQMYPDSDFTEVMVLINGTVVDEHRFVKLSCAPDHYHGGVEGAGVRWVAPASSPDYVLANYESYSWIDGIEFTADGAMMDSAEADPADPFEFIFGSAQTHITNCMFHDVNIYDANTPGMRKVDEISANGASGIAGLYGRRTMDGPELQPTVYGYSGNVQGVEGMAGINAAIRPPDPSGPTPNIKNSGAAYTSNGAVASATLTLTKPTGASAPAIGDTLLLLVGTDDPSDIQQFDQGSVGQGFVFRTEEGDSIADVHAAIFSKVCDGTEGATVDVTSTGPDDITGFYIVVENAGSSILPFSWQITSGTSHVIGEITTPHNNCLAFYFLSYDGEDATFDVSGAGWAEVAEEHIGAGTNGHSIVFGTKDMGTAGLTGDATVGSVLLDGAWSTQFCLVTQNDPPVIKGDDVEIDYDGPTVTQITATKPTGAGAPSVGDLLVIMVGNDSSGVGPEFDDVTYKPTGGFDLVATAGSSGVDAYVAIFTRVCDGNESATETCYGLSSTDMWCAYMVIEGQHATYALAVDDSNIAASGAVPWIIGGCTPTVPECLILFAATVDGASRSPCWIGEISGYSFCDALYCRGGVMINNLIYRMSWDDEFGFAVPFGRGCWDYSASNNDGYTHSWAHNTVAKVFTGLEVVTTVDASTNQNNLYIANDSTAGLNNVGSSGRENDGGNAGNSQYSYADFKLPTPGNTFVDWDSDDFHIKKDHYIGCGIFPYPYIRITGSAQSGAAKSHHHPRFLTYLFHDIEGKERGYTDPDQDIVPGCFAYTLASDEARWTKKTIQAADGDYTTITAWDAALTVDPTPSSNDETDRGELYMGYAEAAVYDEAAIVLGVAGAETHGSNMVLRAQDGDDHRNQRHGLGVRIHPTAYVVPLRVALMARAYNLSLMNQYDSTGHRAGLEVQTYGMVVNCAAFCNDLLVESSAVKQAAVTITTPGVLIGVAGVGPMIDGSAFTDQRIESFSSTTQSDWACYIHCTAMGHGVYDESLPTGLEYVGFFNNDSSTLSGEGQVLVACLFVADESDASVTGYFCRDVQATQAGWDAAIAYHCFSSCAGQIGTGGGFPDITHECEGGLSETDIFTVETEDEHEPNLDAFGANVDEVAHAMRMDYSAYQTDTDLLTMYPLQIRDANGALRKDTPGCAEAGGSAAPVITVNGLDNNSATFRYTDIPSHAQTAETDIVEASGDFANPFSQNFDTPPETPWTMTGLTDRFDWMARLRYLDEYGWPSFWSSTIYFATLALLRERPRLGPLVNYGRSGLAWMIDRRGALIEMTKHAARLGHWVKISGTWRRVLLLEEERVNKCETPLDYEAGPPPTINFDGQSGGAIFESVEDADALNDAGLQAVVPEDRVVHADNSEGSSQWVALKGEVGNTNVHALSIIARGTGTLKLGLDDGSGETDFTLSPTYQRFFLTAIPSGSALNLRVRILDGDEIWFVLPQLEEGSFHTSNIVQTSTSTTLTRGEESPQSVLPASIGVPQAMTIYLRFIAFMDYDQVPAGATFLKIGSLLTAPEAGEETWEIGMNTSDQPCAIRNVAGAEKTAALSVAAMQFDRLDEVELAIVVNSDGTWRLVGTVESSSAYGADGTTFSLTADWQSKKVYVAPDPGAIGLIDIKFIRGSVIGSDQDILNRCRTVGYRKAP